MIASGTALVLVPVFVPVFVPMFVFVPVAILNDVFCLNDDCESLLDNCMGELRFFLKFVVYVAVGDALVLLLMLLWKSSNLGNAYFDMVGSFVKSCLLLKLKCLSRYPLSSSDVLLLAVLVLVLSVLLLVSVKGTSFGTD